MNNKHYIISLYVFVLTLFLLIFGLFIMIARSDAPDEYMFYMVATPVPDPPPTMPPKPYIEYDWSDAEIDGLASVYWSECNTDAEKLAVTKLIMNRSTYGKPFATGIVGVIYQKGEFNRGRISDRNRQNAEDNLNRIMNGKCFVPDSAVYMSRNGKTLILYDFDWNEVYRCD